MGRRAGVALALVVVFAAVSPAPATAAEPARLEEKIRQRVRTFRGVLGVAATNLDTGEHVAFNGDVRFPTASLIKLAVMVETYIRSTRESSLAARYGRSRNPARLATSRWC
jgi:beta-lactamase class A